VSRLDYARFGGTGDQPPPVAPKTIFEESKFGTVPSPKETKLGELRQPNHQHCLENLLMVVAIGVQGIDVIRQPSSVAKRLSENFRSRASLTTTVA
jgi:hypothetical protein